MTAVISITFDYHAAAYNSITAMQANGIRGTMFSSPYLVGTAGALTLTQMVVMQQLGWEHGIYSGNPAPGMNMVSYFDANGRDVTRAKLLDYRHKMEALGFYAKSFAPAGRQWNASLRNLSSDIFRTVRVCADAAWQQLPVGDPLYVNGSAIASLGDTAYPTEASLLAKVDELIANGGFWPVVAHKVGEDSDPDYSISAAKFTAFCQKIGTEVAAGNLIALPFSEAIEKFA